LKFGFKFVELFELKSDSMLHHAAGSQISPFHNAVRSQISPLQFTTESQISPMHDAAWSQVNDFFRNLTSAASYSGELDLIAAKCSGK
jgi:hypothetical protein